MTSRSTANNDQFLLCVHVVEVTGKVVGALDVVELDELVVVVVESVVVVDGVVVVVVDGVVVVVVTAAKTGKVVLGTATLLGQ
jgi:hypothetical protein